MQILTIVSPAWKTIATVPKEELGRFLVDRGLVARRANQNATWIAMEPIVKARVEAIERGEDKHTIFRWRHTGSLAQKFVEALGASDHVSVVVGKNAMRPFYGTGGFVGAMEELRLELPQAAVYIPAGNYVRLHIFGLQRGAQGGNANG